MHGIVNESKGGRRFDFSRAKVIQDITSIISYFNFTLLRSAISEIWSQRSLIIMEYRVKLEKEIKLSQYLLSM